MYILIKIVTLPIYGQLSISRDLPLESLSIITPKASTIRLRNFSDTMGCSIISYRIIDLAHLPYLFNSKVNINCLGKWDVPIYLDKTNETSPCLIISGLEKPCDVRSAAFPGPSSCCYYLPLLALRIQIRLDENACFSIENYPIFKVATVSKFFSITSKGVCIPCFLGNYSIIP